MRKRNGSSARASESSSNTEPTRTLRPVRRASEKTVLRYWDRLIGRASEADRDIIADASSLAAAEAYSGNIENYIGTIKVPVGVIGPLRVNGVKASGDYNIPLATTEAALVASYGRGAFAATKAGGIDTAVLYEGVIRTPAFILGNLLNAGLFVEWIAENIDSLRAAAQSTTQHGKLTSIDPVIDNDVVFLMCRYLTGDASGQNMVTIATQALCEKIASDCTVPIKRWYIESNFSGDKKASALGLITGRGRKVSASVVLPAAVIEKFLNTTAKEMLAYGRIADLGAKIAVQMGSQAHYSNALAALYIATGQDAACVAESAIGISRVEPHGDDVFFSVTMPNIIVGTVGGGTGLPSQSAALNLLGLNGPGNASALAEVTAALCLCGEISIVAAIASGDFTSAHENLARLR